jgi:deoxyribodipyrimidine photo-lyase
MDLMSMPAPVVHWFRRDLRIADNQSLFAATSAGRQIVPVYILSDWKGRHTWTGAKRQHFLCGCLASLSRDLEAIGGRLILRQGETVAELETLLRESGARELHFNADPDPFGKAVERRIFELCAQLGVSCHAHHDVTLHHPDEVLTQNGSPYRVFTPYSRNWLTLEKPEPVGTPRTISAPAGLLSLPLPSVRLWSLDPPAGDLIEPGERAARARLKRAIETTLPAYAEKRDFPAEEGTSRLSQDLRFGLLSIRTVYAHVMEAREHVTSAGRKGIETFIKELAWREFYFAILHHFPNVLKEEFNPDWRSLPWDEPGEKFEAWEKGRTGFPIVDAGIRELLATGFMHNRVRMIVAMFLTKDLHLDWRLGESFFLQHLVDGEIASNNGGWQWSAGTGADAAPYFRIQNPWTQAKRYDPAGVYIRRWVPELATVPLARLFEPPKDGQPIAPGYPLPIVNHATERDRTLTIFKRHADQRR